MSLMPIPADIIQFEKVGNIPNLPGKILVFCNGIMHSLHSARESALGISKAFRGREVFIAYNPTDLSKYFKPDIPGEIDLKANLGRPIVKFIKDARESGISDTEICVTLFAHSYGVVLTKHALSIVGQKDRYRIKVYAFGGAAIIPKRLALVAKNYFSDNDIISKMGNVKDGDFTTFCHAKNIHKRMRAGVDYYSAIGRQAYDDLRHELHPFNTINDDENTRSKKNAEYQAIFVKGDRSALENSTFFIERLSKYHQCFSENTIIFLPPKSSKQVYWPPKSESFSAFFKNAVTELIAGSDDALANHEFNFYLQQVSLIAHQELRDTHTIV